MSEKYKWFNNHEEAFSYTVAHVEENEKTITETLIALTDSAEKADFITKACNQFNLEKYEQHKT